MTPQQNLALTIHDHSRHGADTLRDSDLVRLAEVWPGLQRVFEEVQALRGRVDDLQDEVQALRGRVDDLQDEVDALQDENACLRAGLDER